MTFSQKKCQNLLNDGLWQHESHLLTQTNSGRDDRSLGFVRVTLSFVIMSQIAGFSFRANRLDSVQKAVFRTAIALRIYAGDITDPFRRFYPLYLYLTRCYQELIMLHEGELNF